MVGGYPTHRRLLVFAPGPDLFRHPATAVIKAAPRRQIDGVDDITVDCAQVCFVSDLLHGWNRRDQSGRVGVGIELISR